MPKGFSDSEVKALIALLDDTDREVFDHVSEKLLEMGPAVIDILEDAYTTIPDTIVQERIENIIHHIQFSQVKEDLAQWAANDPDDLLKGLLIMNRYQYPLMDEEEVMRILQQIRKDAWLALNYYQSPLKQIDAINQVLFGQFGIKSVSQTEIAPRCSYLGSLITSKKGNPFSIGLLYLALCQQLDLPVFGVCLRAHFILVRTHDALTAFDDLPVLKDQVLFYINPYNKGLTFGEREIRNYLKKAEMEVDDKYFLPASNLEVMAEFIEFLIEQYRQEGSDWKTKDLAELIELIRHQRGFN
jgi:regulator of sirC expression with transglutaminase-like and TPR domain